MTDHPQDKLKGGELATFIMEAIENNKNRWDQGSWRADSGTDAGNYCAAPTTAIEAFVDDPFNPACTTSFCFAGWVGAYDGVKWVLDSFELIGDPDLCNCRTRCCVNEDHHISVGDYAQRRLGIYDHEARALFSAENTLGELRAGVQAIVDGNDVTVFLDGPDYYGDGDGSCDEDEEYSPAEITMMDAHVEQQRIDNNLSEETSTKENI